MPDREKVLKGLELCTDISGRLCVSCPYYTDTDCPEQLCADALALLKEQEERIGMLTDQIDAITKWRANAGAFD